MAILVLFICLLIPTSWFLGYILSSGSVAAEKAVVVYIPKGASSKNIGELLAEKKLVNGGVRFVLLARIMGKSARLQAGEFLLHTGQTPVELIKELSRARPVEHSVTIPEGLDIVAIAAIFEKQGWGDGARLVELANDGGLIESLGLAGVDSLEGYLFPDTYHLVRPAPGEKQLVRMLAERSLKVWREIEGSAADDHGLTRHQVFTLASIIEKETGKAEERAVIASVFLNRLKRGMRLQSDPTVMFGIENFSGRLTRTDLRTPTPYNTYVISGLPPGPICSPGREALSAVLHPADADYLYFVSKNDGSHYFSKTLKEHNRAVRKYQRNRK